MKVRKTFLIFTIVGLMTVLLCLPGAVFAKSPNPPLPGADEKLIGPMLKGILIVGWKDSGTIELGSGSRLGTAEGFLHLEGKLYTAIIAHDVPLEGGPDTFTMNTAADVPGWPLPCEIVDDYDMGICPASRAVIFEEKDVSNFRNEAVENLGLPPIDGLSYEHVIYCEVRVSFIIPKK